MPRIFQWIALIAAVIFFLAITGVVISSSQQSDDHSQQQTTEKNSSEQAEENSNKTLWDRWFPDAISIYTLFLMIFTAILAFGTLIQLSILNSGERTAALAAQAAKDSADAAKSEFISAHRPRIRVKAVTVITPNGGSVWNPIAILYSVKNVGDTPAIVGKRNFAVKTINPGSRLKGMPSFDAQNERSDVVNLSGGSGTLETFVSGLSVIEKQQDISNGHLELVFYGYIDYSDKNNVPRETIFLQRWDPQSERFFTIEDPDYNHAD